MDLSFLTRESAFRAFSTSHLMAMGMLVVALLISTIYSRSRLSRRGQKRFLLGVSLIPLMGTSLLIMMKLVEGEFSYLEDLPIHICRVLAIVAPIVYWQEKPWATGICYFWIMVGTVNAALTPDLLYDFPHWEYLSYFILHNSLIFLPMYYVLVMGHRIRHRDLWLAIAAANGFLLFSLIFNKLVGSNYMYSMHKPETASLLDYLGPWPWYLVIVQLVGVVLFYTVYLPFVILDRMTKTQPSHDNKTT